MTYKPFEPDWTVPPGDALAELLVERGLGPAGLRSLFGDNEETVKGILTAQGPVTAEIAAELERVLGGPSAQFWLNYEKNYQDDLVRLGRACRICTRCLRHLVDEDDAGWYYQVPVTNVIPAGRASCGDRLSPETTLTFMDRVHECDGRPHDVIVRDRELMAALEVARQCPYC